MQSEPAKTKRPAACPPAQKHTDRSAAESTATTSRERKPWRKKSPAEVFFEQEDKLRAEVLAIEAELKDKREQLGKFDPLFESRDRFAFDWQLHVGV